MNINIIISKNIFYIEKLTIFQFWLIFLNMSGLFIRLVHIAATAIPYMFLLTFLYIISYEIKKKNQT